MAYLEFNKDKLVNLGYSLQREVLGTNRAGAYMTSTIICCNTRKYHGLLIAPVDEFGGENHVLLSGLDETIIQKGSEFNLAVRKYPSNYEPRGHKYITNFKYEPIYNLTYCVGGDVVQKEIIFVHNENQILIRYTLLESTTDTVLRLKPFLAFRNIHALSKANTVANTEHKKIDSGIASKLYDGFPTLNMQVSKNNEFIAMPDWYYNIEYTEERNRGYDHHEDLFVPGYFELPIAKGESIVFSASLEPTDVSCLNTKFQKLLEERSPRNNFENCMRYSASQFIVKRGSDTEIVAGYPWFGRWGRDTFIALPGVTLSANNDIATCKDVLDTMIKELQNGLFPNIGKLKNASYNSVDAPMWFFKAVQEYTNAVQDDSLIWNDYGVAMKAILEVYRVGVNNHVKMMGNNLIWADEPGKALTWMDAIVNGVPVTPRSGYQVEINALWYNAICYTLKLATKFGDNKFVESWKDMPEKVQTNFVSVFWYKQKEYLADFVDAAGQNVFVRPNQVFACSLEFSPITDEMKSSVLKVVRRELLTPKGLRTLAPKNDYFEGEYEGGQDIRDSAYHQGTVWPWLIGAYIEANFRLLGKSYVEKAKAIIEGFEEDIAKYGVCSIGEVYDGNPPHIPNGCISQGWSVGEILRSIEMIKKYEKE